MDSARDGRKIKYQVSTNIFKKQKSCTNCGVNDHTASRCSFPIISCGIIVTKICGKNLEFLLIRRRNSLSFVEFIRGKYILSDEGYIGNLLSNMTVEEQTLLKTMNFKELWSYVWNTPLERTPESHIDEYNKSQENFNAIHSCIDTYVEKYKSRWEEPEWGFPKGRREKNESDLVCAKREVYEETNLSESDYIILDFLPILEETFRGSNGINYTHRYHLARLNNPTKEISKNANEHMKYEIGDIQWFTFDESMNHIRPTNIEKRKILVEAHKKLTEYIQ